MKIHVKLPKPSQPDKAVLLEMKKDLKQVLFRPFLILFKIPASILGIVYQGVCMYSVLIPQCIGRLLLFPLNLLISLCEHISFGQVRLRIRRLLRVVFFRFHSRSDLNRQSPFREGFCCLFAFLLQAVSFFTTYAGLELYFGNVFSLAPFLITIVIQGTLYLTVVTVFRPGKHRWAMAACMAVFTSFSILFSYTGLVTLYHSPADEFLLAYENYENSFLLAKEHLLADSLNQDQAFLELQKAMNRMDSIAAMAEQELSVRQEQRDSIQVPPRFTSSRSVSVNPDGSRTTTTAPVETNGYQEAIDRIAALNSDISVLNAGAGAIRNFLETHSGSTAVTPQFEADFSRAAESASLLGDLLQVTVDLDPDLVRTCSARMEQHNRILAITLALPDSVPASSTDTMQTSSAPASSLMQGIWQAGHMIGADFQNTSLEKLTALRENISRAVSGNYDTMQLLGAYPADLARMRAARDAIDNLPGIIVYAARQLTSPLTRSDALFCLCLALFNDLAAILLGYAGTSRQPETIFAPLFHSMQEAFIVEIKNGCFDLLNGKAFEQACHEFVRESSDYLNSFQQNFALSACTSREGYSLCWICLEAEKLTPYLPVITVFLQAGFLKVVPLRVYREIRSRYESGLSCASPGVTAMDGSIHRQTPLPEPDARLFQSGDSTDGCVLLLQDNAEYGSLQQFGYSYVMNRYYKKDARVMA